MTHRFCGLLPAIISMIVLSSSCSDNGTTISTSSSSGDSSGCSSTKDCDNNQICLKGTCFIAASEGEDCSDKATTVCVASKCVDGICTTNSSDTPDEKDDECDNDNDCKGELVCKNHKCVQDESPVDPPHQNDVISCSQETECPSDMVCGYDEVCHNKVGLNEACEDSSQCPETQFCSLFEQTCKYLLGAGELCHAEYECQSGLICSGVCMAYSRTIGQSCNDYMICDDSTDCVNGICVLTVGENETCDTTHICDKNMTCYNDGQRSKCIIDRGGCQSDEDCSGDSYCCLEASCQIKNTCLPYGEGPRGNQNLNCNYKTVPGLFEAAIQCEWKEPAKSDPYPDHKHVLMTPLVMNTPHDSGQAQEIIFTSYNNTDGGEPSGWGSKLEFYGVIRIINAETCELHESIFDDNNRIIGGSNLAMADVDNDGYVEIIAGRALVQKNGNPGGGLVAFHWNASKHKYVTWWTTTDMLNAGAYDTTYWGGPSIHDLNNDGKPEVIGSKGMVFNALDGTRLNAGQSYDELVYIPIVGDIDNDKNIEIIGKTNIYRWNKSTNKWTIAYPNVKSTSGSHFAFADFGTPSSSGGFNFDKRDGIAEVVTCGSHNVNISTLEGTSILNVSELKIGGPCTVGDFDGDGMPEVAAAFENGYRIFDPRCKSSSDGCQKPYILWEKESQDMSSGSTGSSLFDFDGDGAIEAVYADECYTRVYDGKTGDVLFSAYSSSKTWHEYPVIADVDNDQSAEIVVGANNKMTCPTIDPVHRGLRCESNSDCKSGNCRSGLCRCTSKSQCNSRTDTEGNILEEYDCVNVLDASDNASQGKVCRAIRENDVLVTGVRVMKDRLDRWMSSRNIWNQHAYSITNINDDQTIPSSSAWTQNFLNASLNNYRQNKQGGAGANQAPDITGRFIGNTACSQKDSKIILGAEICNRGTKMVSKLMPASFYAISKDQNGNETRDLLCTSYTSQNVPVGGCLRVTCTINDIYTGDVVLVANDDGQNGRTTVECNDLNNEDRTTIESCPIEVN